MKGKMAMERIIRTVKTDEFEKSALFVKKVFTESEDEESGTLEHIKGGVEYSFYESLR